MNDRALSILGHMFLRLKTILCFYCRDFWDGEG